VIRGERQSTIAGLSKPFSGSVERVAHGAICRRKFGRWHTVYMRFSRWRRKGVWESVAQAMFAETQIKHVLIGSTIVRAHQHSAGAKSLLAHPVRLGHGRHGAAISLAQHVDHLFFCKPALLHDFLLCRKPFSQVSAGTKIRAGQNCQTITINDLKQNHAIQVGTGAFFKLEFCERNVQLGIVRKHVPNLLAASPRASLLGTRRDGVLGA
jgi:hypothetical protein